MLPDGPFHSFQASHPLIAVFELHKFHRLREYTCERVCRVKRVMSTATTSGTMDDPPATKVKIKGVVSHFRWLE